MGERLQRRLIHRDLVRGVRGRRQLRLLLRKNVQIHRRNYVSTTVQLCLPIFISFMLWVLGANDKYNRAGYNAMTFELRHPPTIEVAAFPACGIVNHAIWDKLRR